MTEAPKVDDANESAMQIAINKMEKDVAEGRMSINEARAKFGMPPVEGGDVKNSSTEKEGDV